MGALCFSCSSPIPIPDHRGLRVAEGSQTRPEDASICPSPRSGWGADVPGLSKTRLCLGLPQTEAPPGGMHSPEAVPGAAEGGGPRASLCRGEGAGMIRQRFESIKGKGSPRPQLPSSPREPSRCSPGSEEGAGSQGHSSPAPTHPPLHSPAPPQPVGGPGRRSAPAARGRAQPGLLRPFAARPRPRHSAPPATSLPWQPREPPGAHPPACQLARLRERSAAAAAGSSSSSRAYCDPAPQPARRLRPGSGPPSRPLTRPQRPPGRWPLWSCWPQPSAQPALWTTTAPPRRATRATRRQDTCSAGED